jgi:two-component system chemotaxis sensor kinase CheA
MEQLDDILQEFLVESYENLDEVDRDLVALETHPDDRNRVASIFRAVHTIKGTSGFLALPKMEHLAHVGESLLVNLRDGELTLTSDIADGLLLMVDALRKMLRDIERGGTEGDEGYSGVVSRLEELVAVNRASPRRTSAAASESPTSCAERDVPRSTAGCENALPNSAASVDEADARGPVPIDTVDGGDRDVSVADCTVRIDVKLLDKLMNLVGELVLARNQILQYGRAIEDSTISAASQRLNHITTELQEGVMKTRMQPIRNI